MLAFGTFIGEVVGFFKSVEKPSLDVFFTGSTILIVPLLRLKPIELLVM